MIPPNLMEQAIRAFNGNRQKAETWFRYPNGWIVKPGSDGPVLSPLKTLWTGLRMCSTP
jgi:hypothetical protein